MLDGIKFLGQLRAQLCWHVYPPASYVTDTKDGKAQRIYAQSAEILEYFLQVSGDLDRHYRSIPELHLISTEIQLMVPCHICRLLAVVLWLRRPAIDALRSGSGELMTLGLCSLELWTGNVALSTIRAGVVDVELIDAILAIVHVPNGLIAHTGNAQVFTVLSVKILGRIGDAAGVDSLVHHHGTWYSLACHESDCAMERKSQQILSDWAMLMAATAPGATEGASEFAVSVSAEVYGAM